MEILQNNVKCLQKELAAKNNLTKRFMEVQTDVLKFVLSFQKNATEKLHKEQASFYQQNHSHLLGNSQQQQQISNIHQHQTVSQTN